MFKITESHKDKVDFVIMYLKTYLNLCNGSIFLFMLFSVTVTISIAVSITVTVAVSIASTVWVYAI